ncbi:DUF488 domain-containing protein [Flavilitoribacter nigricans]|uniref:DUF488 domain-containing protein n=1 Tax=Flavilitoribacter nigricans (strain ATCC 23147 / DSM 23189 / NBRC 102662 / NCIMB 1420 / SS-2) TaxID=1122177 RepID=A0A2D0N5F8_FLAN2|nr:DUF488 domain-containing protein [Flavilitoribacter nigricans]PHN03003.1 hypothetical protein CRP01_29815 [Flavilitoribacter nigricans DSM 23189 = NBRC 102662]
MYYRRKILLALAESFPSGLSKTQFQKLLFLMTRGQSKKAYDFVPYKYGCFSFQAANDIRILTNSHLLRKQENSENTFFFNENESIVSTLKKEDRDLLQRIKIQFGEFSQEELIKHTYIEYPYYAINSKIANRLLDEKQLEKIDKQRREFSDTTLFTIGYEGISLENYINKLIINGVELLVDVRKNSFSMKYGFSKSQLQNACQSVDIQFIHIPELGIESSERKKLNSIQDYKELFDRYESSTLMESNKSLENIVELIKAHKRIALTCFEREVCMCHRGRITKRLSAWPDWDIPIRHL